MNARLALITSGHNEIARAFHRFPEQPVALIEVPVVSKPHHASQSRCAVYAMKHGFEYACVDRCELHRLSDLLPSWQIDLAITYSVPYLKLQWLKSLRFGAVNLHHALLPAYRGGNPLLWQVIDGVTELGVSVHCVAERLDAGNILAQTTVPKPSVLSKAELARHINTQAGLDLLLSVIPDWVAGSLNAVRQPEHSPTPPANHIPPDQLLPVLRSKQATLERVWEVATLFGSWPDDTLNQQSWCRDLRWVPVRKVTVEVQRHSQENPIEPSQRNSYYYSISGYESSLVTPQGCVVFRPQRFVYARLMYCTRTMLGTIRSLLRRLGLG